jgi:hypothetical protein
VGECGGIQFAANDLTVSHNIGFTSAGKASTCHFANSTAIRDTILGSSNSKQIN